MMGNEGTIKVRNWWKIIILSIAMIGTIITALILALAFVSTMPGDDLFVFGFLGGLTIFQGSLMTGFALFLFEHITNEKYFKEVKVKID